ncbi:hypothetical protein [Luteipulveratus flavus]|uniref:DUF115 domain-containing protein n=1 Tax=Luteipulveratus flavus TaxID=3031728 RepID=A0ABT6C3S2_9MICO|nr:hypothetical protein [Luteipulveratus sp. YIM 133296]MDF8262937.1 hypothetical protein [Luteipulveratus sp. YIM 133296]
MPDDFTRPGVHPRLIGGEMATWSDLATTAPLRAIAPAVLALVPEGRRRVLLAGPRAALLRQHFRDHDVRVLVRGVPHAEALAQDGADVVCGALDRLPAGSAYDVVVLLDPPETVLSPDSPGLSHGDTLGLAADAVADDGCVVALVPGGLGLDTLTAGTQPHRLADDTAWWVGTDGYDVRRPFRHELPGLLGDAGLTPWVERSLLPTGADPVVVLDGASEDAVRDAHEALAAAVHAVPYADRAVDVLAGGAAAELAGAWLVVAGRSPRVLHAPALVADPGLGEAVDGPLRGHRWPLLLALRDGNLSRARTLLEELRAGCGDDTSYDAALVELAGQVAGAPGAHPFAPELDAQAIARELRILGGLAASAAEVAAPTPRAAAHRPPAVAEDVVEARREELEAALHDRSAQVADLQRRASDQERRIRALEHAVATADSPWPRRTLFVLTAPTKRLVEAARSRTQRSR